MLRYSSSSDVIVAPHPPSCVASSVNTASNTLQDTAARLAMLPDDVIGQGENDVRATAWRHEMLPTHNKYASTSRCAARRRHINQTTQACLLTKLTSAYVDTACLVSSTRINQTPATNNNCRCESQRRTSVQFTANKSFWRLPPINCCQKWRHSYLERLVLGCWGVTKDWVSAMS